MSKIDDLTNFIQFTHKFREIKRTINNLDGSIENDSEHSYQLAMTGWYLISKHRIPLDMTLVIKYALVHDIPETHASDTWAYDTNKKKKKEKESKAREKLKEEFPDFRDLHHLINDYERLISKEAQFVYALDKLLPMINIYLCKGDMWKEHNITLEQIKEYKTDKIKVSPDVEPYYKELLTILETNEKELFN